MTLKKETYDQYVNILTEELVPALGCTEPIAIAYAAAKARAVLGEMPDRIVAECSGNIVKNVKGVIVPNSGNLSGIAAATIVGVVGGNAEMSLEVLHEVTAADIELTKRLEKEKLCEVKLMHTAHTLHIIIRLFKGDKSAMVEIKDLHNNIVRIEKNGEVLMKKEQEENKYCGVLTDRNVLKFNDILEFSKSVEIEDIQFLIDRQIRYNWAIAVEGLTGKYGVAIGNTFLKNYTYSINIKMRAYASAASEARMGGCILPVVTNSGSGNQGITTSVPLIAYAKEYDIADEILYRGLVFANLMTIYQKSKIGRMSAFCAAVSSACSVGAALTFMKGGSVTQIRMAINNALANASGIICDGAKVSCAAKIASSLDSGLLAHYLAMDKKVYEAGSGILKSNVDETIISVGRMASLGMRETDEEILEIMLEEDKAKTGGKCVDGFCEL